MTVVVYPGFTEHAYRLLFAFEDHFSTTPYLQTIRPDGIIETEKVLKPALGKGVLSYPYPQTIPYELCSQALNSPFIHARSDGTYLVSQVWPTNYNDKFKKDYTMSTTNPNPNIFSEVAAEAFKKTCISLWGEEAHDAQIVYCHRASLNNNKAYVGPMGRLLMFLREHPNVVSELGIITITENGFITCVVDGHGQADTKQFTISNSPNDETNFVLYVKQGWDTMACVTPLNQFLKDRVFFERPEGFQ